MASKPIAKQAPPKPKRMPKEQKIAIKLKPFIPHEVIQPAPTAKSARGLSLKELISNSESDRQTRANYVVHVETAKRVKTAKGLPAVDATAWYEDLLRPNSKEAHKRYTVHVIGLDDPNLPIYKQKRVLISCSCPDWVFTWEYANAIHGATKIIFGNGQPPVRKNAGCAPGLCKHSLGVAEYIMERRW